VRFRHVTRAGRFVRVADPDWRRPLDPSFAASRGGRWNPPGSFPVLYLCASRAVARRVVLGRFEGLPYGLLDVRPDRRPVLIETDVAEHGAVDVVSDAGCRAAKLPATYPYDARGRKIGWSRTQAIGIAAWEQEERSIACRSAALPRGGDGEELAWFVRERADRLTVSARRSFDDWF
jgi:RES domain-containing protein